MLYKLLGMLTWKGAKWFLRRKYGAARVPAPLLAGTLLLAILGVAFATRRRGGEA